MLALAREAQFNSYSPYSHFRVGAALLCADGTIFPGCNVESGAYSPSICAERAAITAAIVAGKRNFVGIIIVTDETKPTSPCGVCRQVLSEFSPKGDLIVISVTPNNDKKEWRVHELLPDAFQFEPPTGEDK
jgi:cytidine deaminase